MYIIILFLIILVSVLFFNNYENYTNKFKIQGTIELVNSEKNKSENELGESKEILQEVQEVQDEEEQIFKSYNDAEELITSNSNISENLEEKNLELQDKENEILKKKVDELMKLHYQ